MPATETKRPGALPAGGQAPRDAEDDVGKRRHLTMLFSDLCSSTQIASRLEAEDYSDLMGRLHMLYRQVVPRHGGTVVQISGDGMLAIFGYPDTAEGDARRAVAAALELHAAARCLGMGFAAEDYAVRLHSGIHAGLILLNPGDAVSGRFSALGDSTNVASRLCSAAGADDVLISEATLGRERRFFATGEPRVLRLRGKADPVRALPILHCAAGVVKTRSFATAFIGRSDELGALDEWRDGPRSTPAAAVIGPAGVGKTRLVEEFLSRSIRSGWDVHRGVCDAQAGPLSPVVELLRSILGVSADGRCADPGDLLRRIDGRLGAHVPDIAHLLGASVAADQPGGAGSRAVRRALCTILATVARTRRLILFLDDWQAADDATRDVFDTLRTLDDAPIRLVVTARDRSSLGPWAAAMDVLPLAPFTPAETADAVSRLLPAADPFLAGRIQTSSGGNPLYVEEVCHWLARGGREERRIEQGAWLNGVIAARLARLSAAQRAIVQTAAVIGNVVPAWLLELMTGRPMADPIVASLADEDFLFADERAATLRFKHGVTRDVAYTSVGLRSRATLHRRIADALRERIQSGDDHADALAYHYRQAGDGAATAHYAELAGDKAVAASALDRAQAHYRTALDALDRLPPTRENVYRSGLIAQRFGLAGVFDPSPQQLPIFVHAVAQARGSGDVAALAWAEYWLGYINFGIGRPGQAIDHYRRALAAATETQNDVLSNQLEAALGQAGVVAGDYAGALPLLDHALAEKRRHWTGKRPAVGYAYTLSCKGFALGDLGRFDEAHGCFEEAMAAAQGQREIQGSILSHRSGVCLWQGDLDAAAGFAAAAEAVGRRVRSLYFAAMSRALSAYAEWRRSGDPRCVAALIESTRWLELSGKRQFLSLPYGWLAEGLVAEGRAAQAARYARRALVRHRRDDSLGAAMACRAMARAAHAAGREEETRDLLAIAAEAAERRGSPHEAAANVACAAEIGVAIGKAGRSRVRSALSA